MATWTPDEDKILIEFYETGSREDILSKLPCRTWKSVYKRSVILGLFRPKDNAWKKEEDERATKFYPNTSKNVLMTLFPGRTWKALSWHAINVLRLTRTKEIVQEETRKTNQSKLGVDYPTQSAAVRDKVKETVRERYGVDNVFQSEEIKQKLVKTNLEKFGVENPNQCPKIRQKTTATNLERYDVENTFQLVDRVQKGMIDKYGETCPLRVPEIKKRQQETNIKRYGSPTPSKNIKVQEKSINTSIDRFGTLAAPQNPSVKEKIIQTNISRYGIDNPAKLDEIKEKTCQTCLNKYGVKYTQQVQEFRNKGYETSKRNGSFESSEEEENFGIYLKMIDPKTIPHKKHPELGHIIDFYMPSFDIWVQYDGTYWHGKTRRKNISSRSEKIEKIKKRDAIQNKKIPNLIRFWSDNVLKAIENSTIIELIKNKLLEKNKNFNICHQYNKKIEFKKIDTDKLPFNPEFLSAKDFELSFEKISKEIINFIEKYEWLGTVGVSPKWCFVARYNGILAGVVLINEPTSYSKLLGDSTPQYEALIQRGATASWTPKNLGSRLIMFSCWWMTKNTQKKLFVAYGDPLANEIGTIYQACGFEYLGQDFGNTFLFRHPEFKNNKLFSPQSLKRTSTFIQWCKSSNINIKDNWLNDKGFKNLINIPIDVKNAWTKWIRKIISESTKFKIEKKHKYVLLIGKNKKEHNFLCSLKNYSSLPYPKRF